MTTTPPLTDATRAHLRELSQRLLQLHKVLLDLQRAEYNSDHVWPSGEMDHAVRLRSGVSCTRSTPSSTSRHRDLRL